MTALKIPAMLRAWPGGVGTRVIVGLTCGVGFAAEPSGDLRRGWAPLSLHSPQHPSAGRRAASFSTWSQWDRPGSAGPRRPESQSRGPESMLTEVQLLLSSVWGWSLTASFFSFFLLFFL